VLDGKLVAGCQFCVCAGGTLASSGTKIEACA
jgi:hypothetical protein